MNSPTKPTLLRQAGSFCRQAFLPLVLVCCMIFCAFWIYAEASAQYSWQWSRVWHYLGTFSENGFKAGLLLQGLGITVLLALCSLTAAFCVAFALAFMRLSQSPVLSCAAGFILSLIRNTPLLIQLFLFYFVIADIFRLTPFATAVFSLALFEGVYLAEILRGGIISIPATQWETSFSLGMNLPKTLHYVIMPQVFRNILPSVTGQLISLIKDTSLVSAVAVADLTLQARNVIAETYLSFEIWILTAAMYFLLTLLVSIPSRFIAGRLSAHKKTS